MFSDSKAKKKKKKMVGEVEETEIADEAQDSATIMPSPPNEPMDVPADSPPSDSDSDSDSDSEAQDKRQIEALESELYNNPSNYDPHLQVTLLFSLTLLLVLPSPTHVPTSTLVWLTVCFDCLTIAPVIRF